MGFKIPDFTRIIVVTADNAPVKEYGISKAMIVSLVGLLLVFTGCLGVLLVSYTTQIGAVREAGRLREQLEQARNRVATVSDLNRELERSRTLQERILRMLGVEPTYTEPVDSLAPWSDVHDENTVLSLQRAAEQSITPPPSYWPTAGYVTQEFIEGETNRGILPHLGLDIAGAIDTPITAAGRGLVTRAGWDDFLGNFVEIQHGLGYVTVYGHCSRLAAQRGNMTEPGQVIAYLGDTGQASAPHLHFEVWKEGEAIDPRQVLPGEPPRQ